MSKNLTKNITIYKSISLSLVLSVSLSLLTREGEGVHVENFDKVQIAEKQKFDKVQKLKNSIRVYFCFSGGGVSRSMKLVLSFTEIFITIKALTNIIVIIMISLFLPSTTYFTFKWDFSHIFMCWTSAPRPPLCHWKKWRKNGKKEPKVPSPTRY